MNYSDEFNPEPKSAVKNENKQVKNLIYLVVGIFFGITFVKAEIISWFRIQEMFLMDSFHMYGIIGTAVTVGMISIFIIKKFQIKTLAGETIYIEPKEFNKGNVIGGLLFGFGWALTGACPGPMYALAGSGFTAALLMLLSAIAGTWTYAYFKDKLPH